MATLNKKGVLYKVITSIDQSKSLSASQVHVTNNKGKADKISVKNLAKGNVIKVYKASNGGKLLATKKATGSTVTLSVPQLGKNSGKIYVSITRTDKLESNRVAVAFKHE